MATRIIEMVGTEPRRRFSDDDKARIVSEAMMPGASVLDVARRHRVCTSLVYRWRRTLLRDGVASEALPLPGAAFVPVEVAGAYGAAAGAARTGCGGSGRPGRTADPPGTSHRRAGAEGRAGRVRLIGPPGGVRVYLAAGVTDMRKGFDGLAALVQQRLRQDPFGGAVYAFRGRRGDLVKLLWWDGQGLVLHAKRLERGRFTWPATADGVAVLTPAQLSMLLEGVDWRHPIRSSQPTLAW